MRKIVDIRAMEGGTLGILPEIAQLAYAFLPEGCWKPLMIGCGCSLLVIGSCCSCSAFVALVEAIKAFSH
jgi:hypothetical protein